MVGDKEIEENQIKALPWYLQRLAIFPIALQAIAQANW
jgi:hypothetical protein